MDSSNPDNRRCGACRFYSRPPATSHGSHKFGTCTAGVDHFRAPPYHSCGMFALPSDEPVVDLTHLAASEAVKRTKPVVAPAASTEAKLRAALEHVAVLARDIPDRPYGAAIRLLVRRALDV